MQFPRIKQRNSFIQIDDTFQFPLIFSSIHHQNISARSSRGGKKKGLVRWDEMRFNAWRKQTLFWKIEDLTSRLGTSSLASSVSLSVKLKTIASSCCVKPSLSRVLQKKVEGAVAVMMMVQITAFGAPNVPDANINTTTVNTLK